MVVAALHGSIFVGQAGHFIGVDVDDDLVLLDSETGDCFGLDAVGKRIWTLIEKPVQIKEIGRMLMSRYKIDQATCETQLFDLLEDLRSERMITVSESALGDGG